MLGILTTLFKIRYVIFFLWISIIWYVKCYTSPRVKSVIFHFTVNVTRMREGVYFSFWNWIFNWVYLIAFGALDLSSYICCLNSRTFLIYMLSLDRTIQHVIRMLPNSHECLMILKMNKVRFSFFLFFI